MWFQLLQSTFPYACQIHFPIIYIYFSPGKIYRYFRKRKQDTGKRDTANKVVEVKRMKCLTVYSNSNSQRQRFDLGSRNYTELLQITKGGGAEVLGNKGNKMEGFAATGEDKQRKIPSLMNEVVKE